MLRSAVLAGLAVFAAASPAVQAQATARTRLDPVVPLDTRWPSRTAAGIIILSTTQRAEVESSSDGWVVVTPVGLSGDGEPYPPRRMIVAAEDARAWSAALRLQLSQRVGHLARSDSASLRLPVLGGGAAWFEGERGFLPTDGPPGANFRFVLCEQRYYGYNVADSALLRIADVIDRAARSALAAAPVARRPTLRRPYYASEVGCPARPRRDNARPDYPPLARSDARDARPYEVGTRFVVDTSGRVEPGSVTILPGAPEQIAAAARAMLVYWRFTPARWSAWPIRQVVHAVLTFDPGARTDAEIMHESPGHVTEPRVLFEPTSDGWVRVTDGSWEADGGLRGMREWFLPDSIERWIGIARSQLTADLAEPKYKHGDVMPWMHGVGGHPSGMLLAGYTAPPAEPIPTGPRDTLLTLSAQLLGCQSWYQRGERIDEPLLARARDATVAARRASARPRMPDGRLSEAGEVSCRARMIPADIADPRFPGAQRPRVGPYPATMLPTQARAEVMASVAIDTSGRVEPRSLMVLLGTDPRAAAALRRDIYRYDFTAGIRSGRHVRQRVVMTWVFVPPPSCESADLGLECPRVYQEQPAGDSR